MYCNSLLALLILSFSGISRYLLVLHVKCGQYERENSFFLLFAEYRKVTIGDSIAKHLSGIRGFTLQIFSGRSISQISAKLYNSEAKFIPYEYVIIHAGTNDIIDRHSFSEIISDFGNLVSIC